MNCLSCAETLPKRVGVPKATPSAHSRSSERRDRLVLDLGAVPPPVLVLGDEQFRRELLDVAEAHFRSLGHRALGERVGEPMDVPRGAVVDDGDMRWSAHLSSRSLRYVRLAASSARAARRSARHARSRARTAELGGGGGVELVQLPRVGHHFDSKPLVSQPARRAPAS